MSVLILKEKHCERYYSFSTAEELGLLAALIVRERNKEGWYEDTSDPKLLAKALAGDNKAALKLLRNRDDYEYEGFEIVEPGTVETLAKEAL